MTDIEKLEKIIDDISVLIKKNVKSSDKDFIAWKTRVERFLISRFGMISYEKNQFDRTSFSIGVYSFDDSDDAEEIEMCREGLQETEMIFRDYLNEMKEEKSDMSQNSFGEKDYKHIFIVHGHDGELKQTVARMIEQQGIKAIILSEQPNKGNTIIEKFEENSNVCGAVCLFTADDLGRAKTKDELSKRARQNVVFETGYFMGKLGRSRVVLLADSGVEMPSDLSGVVYTNTRNWELELLKELKTMGYEIDLNRILD